MKLTVVRHNKVVGLLMDMQDAMDEHSVSGTELPAKNEKKLRSAAKKLANALVAAGLLEEMTGKFI